MDRREILSIKKKQLDELSEYREKLYKAPQLRQLFFELTLRCNSACFHCGSRCTPQSPDGLPVGEYLRVLDEVEARYGNKMTQICLTGGEPLLYGDFFELAQAIHDRGFRWGMTSNGTLISREVARKLHETGMGTISISVDGLPETHDRLRGMPGGFERTMTGVRNLIEEGGFHSIQITTVVNLLASDRARTDRPRAGTPGSSADAGGPEKVVCFHSREAAGGFPRDLWVLALSWA